MILTMRNNLFILIIFFSTASYCQNTSDFLMKAKALSAAGNPEMAISLLDNAISSENDFRYFLQRAQVYENTGDYSAAIRDYNEANKLNPFSGEFGLARIYALKGDAGTSLYHLGICLNSSWKKSEKEIMLDPAFGTLENSSEWRKFWQKEYYSEIERYVYEMEYYTSTGNIEDARSLLSEMKTKHPDADELVYSEALLYAALGKHSDAARTMTKLTETPGGK